MHVKFKINEIANGFLNSLKKMAAQLVDPISRPSILESGHCAAFQLVLTQIGIFTQVSFE